MNRALSRNCDQQRTNKVIGYFNLVVHFFCCPILLKAAVLLFATVSPTYMTYNHNSYKLLDKKLKVPKNFLIKFVLRQQLGFGNRAADLMTKDYVGIWNLSLK